MNKSLLAVSLLMIFGAANADTLVADSISEFSGTQGQNSWYYGYQSGDIDSYSLNSFNQFDTYTGTIWQQSPHSGAPWTQLWADGGHPNGTNNSSQLAIRRWVSETNGSITISGTFADQDQGSGNGVSGGIYVDGTQVWFGSIQDGGSTAFSFSRTVTAGSKVDFVLDANGFDHQDSTRFSAQITTAVPEPETYAMFLAGLGLMGGIARRRKQK